MNLRRVLLVYPSQLFCPDPDTRPIVVRTQLVKLYSYLRARDIDVRVLDLEYEFGRPTTERELVDFLAASARAIGTEPFDLVGISCYTSVSYTATLEVARLIRRNQPGARIVVGGYHCLGQPQDFVDCPNIDYVVRGDGIKFLDALRSDVELPKYSTFDGFAPEPKPMLYDEYPYAYGRVPSHANIQLSRGCPFQCSFCCEPFIGNSEFRPLPIDDAIADIDTVVRTLAPDKIVIEDLLFGFSANWRHGFLEALRDRRHRQIFLGRDAR